MRGQLKALLGSALAVLFAVALEESAHLALDRWRESRRRIEQARADDRTHRPQPAHDERGMDLEPPAPPDVPEGVEVKRGRTLDVFVLSQEYEWELGRTDAVKTPSGRPIEFHNKLSTLLRQLSGAYHDLIAVGTASCEMKEEWEERDRARTRSSQLVGWVRDALAEAGDRSDRHLYRLGLGRFGSCHGSLPGQTGHQRRVILLAMKQPLGNVNLVTLRERLDRELFDPDRLLLGFPRSSYSDFDLQVAR